MQQSHAFPLKSAAMASSLASVFAEDLSDSTFRGGEVVATRTDDGLRFNLEIIIGGEAKPEDLDKLFALITTTAKLLDLLGDIREMT